MKARIIAAAGLAVLFSSAEPAPASEGHVRIFSNPDRDAYVLATGGTTMTTSASTDTIVRVQKTYGSDFLWFRRHRRTYVIRDGAILAQVRALFAPLDALRPEQEALGRRQRDLDREEEALDRERDRIQDANDGDEEDDGDSPAVAPTPEDRARVRELDSRIAGLESQERALDAQERELDGRSEEIERQTEEKLWRLIDGWIAGGTAQPAAERGSRE